MKGIMSACSFNKEDHDNILDLLYLKNKQELSDYLSGLKYREPMATLSNILDLEGTFEEVTGKLKDLYLNEMMKTGLEELKK